MAGSAVKKGLGCLLVLILFGILATIGGVQDAGREIADSTAAATAV